MTFTSIITLLLLLYYSDSINNLNNRYQHYQEQHHQILVQVMIIYVFHHQVHAMQTQMIYKQMVRAIQLVFCGLYKCCSRTIICWTDSYYDPGFFSELWTPCHPEGDEKGEMVQTNCLIVMTGIMLKVQIPAVIHVIQLKRVVFINQG